MPTPITTFEQLEARLVADLNLAHSFVHGSDTTTVILESGPVPSLAKIAKDLPFAEKIQAATDQAIAATLSAVHAQTAEKNALNYKNAAALMAQAIALNAQGVTDKAADVALKTIQVRDNAAAVQALRNQAEASAVIAAGYADTLSATSATSVAIALGTKVFQIAGGKQFKAGQLVIVASDVNAMVGMVASYVGTTLTVQVTHITGAGTFANWTVSLTGAPGTAGAAGAAGLAGAAGAAGAAGLAGAAGAAGASGAISTYTDKGTLTAGTVTFNQSTAQNHRVQVGGALTIATAGWPAGALGIMLLEMVNAGAFALTWPTIRWVLADGTFTTTFSANTITLQAAGSDFVTLWSRDGGATVYGKIVR